MEKQALIRNFALIAHVDHGKSTLADRLLERTGTVPEREMHAQFLDSLDLERERGITIKLKAVRLSYQLSGVSYQLNLIDTPGHVDFGYEVSRSLAACEGAILVVDATQGIQAQTVANAYKAQSQNLSLIPFVNKVDLASARVEETVGALKETFGFKEEEIIRGSAKDGRGVSELLSAIVKRIRPPQGEEGKTLRALIFDSVFDDYQGIVAFVKVVDGSLNIKGRIGAGSRIGFLATGATATPLEVGFFGPQREASGILSAGEVGYVATGLKEIRLVRAGDTLTELPSPGQTLGTRATPLPGYREPKPMVFFGLYPTDGRHFQKLRDALGRFQLTDGSLDYEAESSGALGLGFRCGFLGLLHAEIVQERLEREYGLDLISTTPSVPYRVVLTAGSVLTVKRASDLPDGSRVREILEPWVDLFVYCPLAFTGNVLRLLSNYRADYRNIEHLGHLVRLSFKLPLAEMVIDFYDRLKSVSSGFASADYELAEYRADDLCRLDFLVAGDLIEPLSLIVPYRQAREIGQKILLRLKETIRRHQFLVVLQAAVGGQILAREEIPAVRKDVLSKLSGGHRERKDKLLERQRVGKKRLKRIGGVEIPQAAFRLVLEKS